MERIMKTTSSDSINGLHNQFTQKLECLPALYCQISNFQSRSQIVSQIVILQERQVSVFHVHTPHRLDLPPPLHETKNAFCFPFDILVLKCNGTEQNIQQNVQQNFVWKVQNRHNLLFTCSLNDLKSSRQKIRIQILSQINYKYSKT